MSDEIVIPIKLQPPDEDTPGFLDYLESALVFEEELNRGVRKEGIQVIAAFIAQFVVEPRDESDPGVAIRAVRHLSKKQFLSALEAIKGAAVSAPLVEPPTEN